MVLYTHLGKGGGCDGVLSSSSQAALRLLANYSEEQKVLVTTTRRLLRYLTARECLSYSAKNRGQTVLIRISGVSDPVSGFHVPASEEVQGMTFVTPRTGDVEIWVGDACRLDANLTHSGAMSYASVPWKWLSFPPSLPRAR
jgi:hypothetical protein